jgi:hypothetical protein
MSDADVGVNGVGDRFIGVPDAVREDLSVDSEDPSEGHVRVAHVMQSDLGDSGEVDQLVEAVGEGVRVDEFAVRPDGQLAIRWRGDAPSADVIAVTAGLGSKPWSSRRSP